MTNESLIGLTCAHIICCSTNSCNCKARSCRISGPICSTSDSFSIFITFRNIFCKRTMLLKSDFFYTIYIRRLIFNIDVFKGWLFIKKWLLPKFSTIMIKILRNSSCFLSSWKNPRDPQVFRQLFRQP